VSLLSVLLGLTALVLFVVGRAIGQLRPLGFGIAGLGASFAGISVGWALDFRPPVNAVTNPERSRIRAMQIFFLLVVAACVILSFLK
jgi:hypothetical protein